MSNKRTGLIGNLLNAIHNGDISEEDIIEHIHKVLSTLPIPQRQKYMNGLKFGADKLYNILIDEVLTFDTQDPFENENRPIPRKSVIELYGISSSTFDNWRKKGLKTFKSGGKVFVRTKDLEDFRKRS